MLPIQIIKDVTLDSRIRELSIPSPNEPMDLSNCVMLSPHSFPESLRDTKIGDIFYFAGNVNAVSSRRYLESVDPNLTLAQLFTEKGDFYPYRIL